MLSMVEIDFFWLQASAAVILLYQTKNRNFFPLCKVWFSRNIRYQWSSIYGTQYLFLSYTAYNLFMHIIFSSKLFSDFFSGGWEGRKHCGMWHTHICSVFFLFFLYHCSPKSTKSKKFSPDKTIALLLTYFFWNVYKKKLGKFS